MVFIHDDVSLILAFHKTTHKLGLISPHRLQHPDYVDVEVASCPDNIRTLRRHLSAPNVIYHNYKNTSFLQKIKDCYHVLTGEYAVLKLDNKELGD